MRLPASAGAHARLGLTILPGKHGASTRYPGRVYRRDLQRDLATLVELGVRRLILLVEDEELERWGEPAIREIAGAAGVDIRRFPMIDGGTPRDAREMDAILDAIDDGRRWGDVAVACMGGVGRSGTVAACRLVADGLAPADAITAVRAARHPEAIETAAQQRFVAGYARRHSG